MDTQPTSARRPWTLRRPAWTEAERIQRHQDNLLLVLTLLIGAVVGLVVVAFILVTERLGSRLYPADGAAWRRLAIPWRARSSADCCWRGISPAPGAAASRRPRSRCSWRRGYIRLARSGEVRVLVDLAGERHCPRPRGAGGAGRAAASRRSSAGAWGWARAASSRWCRSGPRRRSPRRSIRRSRPCCSRSRRSSATCTRPCSGRSSSARRPPGRSCTWCSATSRCSTCRPTNWCIPLELGIYVRAGHRGRPRLGGLRQAAPGPAPAVPGVAGPHALGAAGRRRAAGGPHRLVRARRCSAWDTPTSGRR